MSAWDISHALTTLYHPYTHEPAVLTEYLKCKLQVQCAKHQSHSHPAQVELNVSLECNNGLGTIPTGLLCGLSCMSNEYGSKGSEALDLPGLSDYFPLEQLEVFKWVLESTRAATASSGEEALRLAGDLVTEGSGGRTGLLNPGMMLVLMS